MSSLLRIRKGETVICIKKMDSY